MANKVWLKTKFDTTMNMEIPHSYNIAQAMYGFRQLGAEIAPYHLIEDIYNKVSQDDIVIDYIDQVQTIFHKFNVKVDIENYPDCLREFLHRKIWIDTINSISSNPDKWSAGWFVKPIKEKAFTGKIISSIKDLIGCGSCYEDYNVICSEPINIKAEWRCFIYYDKILDIRPYGFSNTEHWRYHYNIETVDNILSKFITWQDRPVACSIDIGVIEKDNEYITVLIEVNDCYALGCYGLDSISYAKMISARWSQILDRQDDYHFGL